MENPANVRRRHLKYSAIQHKLAEAGPELKEAGKPWHKSKFIHVKRASALLTAGLGA
jgi:hypothetical protein